VSLETARDKLLALDPKRLPPALDALMLVRPYAHATVQPGGSGFVVKRWGAVPKEAVRDTVCKLGIKSWRDSGGLRPIYQGAPLRRGIELLLGEPTTAQRTLARAWLDTGTPLAVHLLPYVDFRDISETRWLVGPDLLRFVSACERGRSAPLLAAAMPAVQALALQVADHLPPHSHLLDIACPPDGPPRLVEVNPALTPGELKALMAV
jgi:hypothetical protein